MSPTERSPTQSTELQPLHERYDDEIDLFELVAGLWRRKVFIGAVTGAFALVSIAYVLFVATPMFQASALVRPDSQSSLVRLNEPGVIEISPDEAFARVVFEARSRFAQQEVFNRHKQDFLDEWPPEDLTEDDLFIEEFVPSILLVIQGMGANEVVSQPMLQLSFEHKDRDYSAMIVNQLIEVAHQRALDAVLEELRSSLSTKIEILSDSIAQAEARIKHKDEDEIARLQEQDKLQTLELQDQLATLRAKAAAERQDRVVQLRESLQIATELNLEEPTTLQMLGQSATGGEEGLTLSANLSIKGEPEYLKGTRLLKAELNALANRKSDDEFVPEIRELQAKLALLENNRQIEVLEARSNYGAFIGDVEEKRAEIAELQGYLEADYSDASLIRIDQRAVPPRLPSKPNKKLIVIAATVAGGMLAILLALILNAVENRRRLESE